MSDVVVQQIAEVLKEHERYDDGLGRLEACRCGVIGNHHAHVAEQVAARLNLHEGRRIRAACASETGGYVHSERRWVSDWTAVEGSQE